MPAKTPPKRKDVASVKDLLELGLELGLENLPLVTEQKAITKENREVVQAL